MAASWTSQIPETTRNSDKLGLTLLKQAGTGIVNGDVYDFGVAVVEAAWNGDAVADRASVTVVGSTVAVVHDEVGGTVDGTIYAWATDSIA